MATKKGIFQDYQGNELRPDLSAQELLDKIKTVDGTGSGLDADLLGGKSADKFAQLGEDGKLPADSLPSDVGKDTAAEILEKLKTVDGTGSGLDADLLDGKEASSFAESSHTHSLVGYYNNGFMSSNDKVKLDKFGDGFVTIGNTNPYLSKNNAYEATAEGRDNRVLGYFSHVGGRNSFALGGGFAHGERAVSIGPQNFALGEYNFTAISVKITIDSSRSNYNNGDPIFAINEDLTGKNISVIQDASKTSYFIPFRPGYFLGNPNFFKLKSIDIPGKNFAIDVDDLDLQENTFNTIVNMIEEGFLTNNITNFSSINSLSAGQYNLSGGRSSIALGAYGYVLADNSAVIGFSNRITEKFPQGTVVVGSANDESIIGKFIVGIGPGSTRYNGFRIDETGKGFFKNGSETSGADFAEYLEWLDGNPENEDRRGRLVTLVGAKIRLATAEDDFILGIISGRPAVVGNSFEEEWAGRFVTDVYGTPVMSKHMEPAEYDEDGNLVREAREFDWYTINPEYRQDEKYIPRSERPEWGLVGLQGQLVVTDDGTCQPGGYCLPGRDGIATATTDKQGYRIMERKDETHVLVYAHGRIVL